TGVDRGKPAAKAGEDGSDGRDQTGPAVTEVLERGKRCVERGPGTERGSGTGPAAASGFGGSEERTRTASDADSVLVVHPGNRWGAAGAPYPSRSLSRRSGRFSALPYPPLRL